jgi:IclR family transcriptional regulator, KDG regulon repressor
MLVCQGRGMLGTVGKASRVLDLFTNERPEWGVTETAAALEIPRSSAHDLLATLADTGLLRHVEGSRYRLGWKLLTLSSTVLDTSDVRTHARPVMRHLVTKLGATAHLAILDDSEVVYLDKLVPPDGLPVSISAIGRRLPPHCSAVGKILLAHQSRHAVASALERCGMRQYTERTVCSADRLAGELDRVRTAGTARDREGAVAGVCCHAAPISDAGRVVAAISISVTNSAEDRLADRYDEIVRAAGIAISNRLTASGSRSAGFARAQHAVAV